MEISDNSNNKNNISKNIYSKMNNISSLIKNAELV